MEDVAGWHKISAFRKDDADALKNAYKRAQMLKKDSNTNGS